MPTPSGLFVFGTLMDRHLRERVMGARWRSPGRNATLFGYTPVPVAGADYPALKRTPGDKTVGSLLPTPDAAELAALDAHEGDEYIRALVPVDVGRRFRWAYCYLTASDVALARGRWRLDARWRRRRNGYLRRLAYSGSSRTTA